MSQWHRANPDLCGTDADPAMDNEPFRLSTECLIAEGLIYIHAAEMERELVPENDGKAA